MDQHILSGMGAALPPGGVRNLAAKKPKELRLIEVGGIYELHFISGGSAVMRCDGMVPTPVHHDPEQNVMVVVPSVATGTLVHKNETTGEWEGDQLTGFVFPHVAWWRVLYDPSLEAEKNKEKEEESNASASSIIVQR